MVVSKKVPDDEVNMLKAIASVLQFRLRGTGELPDEFYVAKEVYMFPVYLDSASDMECVYQIYISFHSQRWKASVSLPIP